MESPIEAAARRRSGVYEPIGESFPYLRHSAETLAGLEVHDGLSHVLFGLVHGIEESSRQVIRSTPAPEDMVAFTDVVRSGFKAMDDKIGVVQHAMAVEANERENLRDHMSEV